MLDVSPRRERRRLPKDRRRLSLATSVSGVITKFLRSIFRRLPPVARRDERIVALRQRVANLEQLRKAWATGPSYEVRIGEENRLRAMEIELGAPRHNVIGGGKFYVYDLVKSHGIEVPGQFGRWDDPADIPWDELPDAVVIKSAFGTSSRGVRPLLRVEGGWRIATHDTVLNSEQIVADLVELRTRGLVRPPFGAEEFLDDGAGLPPVDVRVHAFYGEVPMIELRRAHLHGDFSASRFRIIDVEGRDLLDDSFTVVPIDQGIPTPKLLDEIVDIASRLSAVLRVPYSRLDMYEVSGRIVFGEVTPRPGPPAWLGAQLDRSIGEAWERAQVRLWRDLAGGMPPEPEWGPYGDDAPRPQKGG